MTTPVVLNISGRVDPALLAGVSQLSQSIHATGEASMAASQRTDAAHAMTHASIRTSNQLLQNLRETGNQGMGELSQKASELAGQMGGAGGIMADVGIKTLAAFGPLGLQVTAVMGAVMMLSRAYDEHQAAIERTRVVSESTAAATAMLGGAYTSVAAAANAATTAEEARLAVAREVQAITAEQVTAVGAGFSESEAQGLVGAYHNISAASRIAGTTVERFTAAQVEHAVSSGTMAEQMMVLGIAIERSSNAQIEHSNVLRRAAAATREAARDAVAAAEAQVHSRDVNQSSIGALRTLATNTTALETARAALTAQTRTANTVEQQQLATQRELAAVAADRVHLADQERERLLAKDELEKQMAHRAATRAASASGPSAAEVRAGVEALRAAQSASGNAGSTVDYADQQAEAMRVLAFAANEVRIAETAARRGGTTAAERAALTAALVAQTAAQAAYNTSVDAEVAALRTKHEAIVQARAADNAARAADIALAERTRAANNQAANDLALAENEKALLVQRAAAHETFTGRLSELYDEQKNAAQLAAEGSGFAFKALADAFGGAVNAVAQEGATVGDAAQEMLAGVLSAIGKEASIKGAFYAAQGLGNLAVGNFPGAGAAFAASAGFFTVAGIAGYAAHEAKPAEPAKAAASDNGGAGGSLRDSAPSDGGSNAPININYWAPVIGGREATEMELGQRLDRYDDASRALRRRAA